MADLAVVPASVIASADSQKVTLKASEAITAGDAVYIDSSTANGSVSLADKTSQGASVVAGIALDNAAVGQPVTIMTKGSVNLGVTLTVGEVYVLSATGNISPVADLVSTNFVSVLGVATDANNLMFQPINSNTAHA